MCGNRLLSPLADVYYLVTVILTITVLVTKRELLPHLTLRADSNPILVSICEPDYYLRQDWNEIDAHSNLNPRFSELHGRT